MASPPLHCPLRAPLIFSLLQHWFAPHPSATNVKIKLKSRHKTSVPNRHHHPVTTRGIMGALCARGGGGAGGGTVRNTAQEPAQILRLTARCLSALNVLLFNRSFAMPPATSCDSCYRSAPGLLHSPSLATFGGSTVNLFTFARRLGVRGGSRGS